MSYVSHDGLAYFKHKLDQKFISNITSENGVLKIILGDGTVLKNIQDTTVTQKKSTANELYPILLCYDAMADQDQLSKETWFGQHILANPYYGYLASRGMYVKHPTFNRRNGVSQKVEWAYDFTDAVSGLGNPMSQVYAYVDPASEGGEHCIELRLYGNPNVSPTVPSVNDSTNTFSIGVGVTGGNVKFGYCPSTPLYLDNGSTLRTEATGHGNDIITRDWLNLNGSLTGLVHTTMNETIDGAKTFKKTVTINSGDNNNKAGLYVQGNSDVHGNEHVYGTETIDGKLTANGTAEIKGGSGNTPSLLVTGNETVTGNESVGGNSSITGNETVGGNISTTNGNISTTNGTVSGKTGSIGSGGLTVAGTTTSTGKITGNGGAEISGGSGLKVNGNETVTGTTTVTGKVTANGGVEVNGSNGLVVNGNETVNGEIYKVVNNTPQEYVSYVTNKQETKTTIVNNLIKDKGGLAVDNNKNIYVNTGKGLNLDNAGKINVDFSQLPSQDVANIISGMVSPGSGLVADSSTGKLAVNFDDMPTDKFTKMMSDMIDAQTISTAGGNNQFYVDGENGSDANPSSRGTPDKPFKSIQACVNFITKVYKFANINGYINCKNINSTSPLYLPSFDSTTASITIRAASFTTSTARNNPTILDGYHIKLTVSPVNPQFAITTSGTGVWNLRNFDVATTDSSLTETETTVGRGHIGSLYLSDYSTVSITDCKFSHTRDSTKPWLVKETNGEHVLFITNYSLLHVNSGVSLNGSDLNASVTLEGAHAGTYRRTLGCMDVGDSALIRIEDTRDLSGSGDVDKRVVISGIFRSLASISGGRIVRNGAFFGGFNLSGLVTVDRKFELIAGGKAQVTDSGLLDADHNMMDSTDTVLGPNATNPDGTDRCSYVQTTTFAWYD